MEKKKISKKVLHRCRTSSIYCDNRFTWGEIKTILKEEKVELQDSDIIEIQFNEGWEEGDSARDSMYDFIVTRQREETDEELQKRKDKQKETVERNRKLRYENYLKLKEEFENEQ